MLFLVKISMLFSLGSKIMELVEKYGSGGKPVEVCQISEVFKTSETYIPPFDPIPKMYSKVCGAGGFGFITNS